MRTPTLKVYRGNHSGNHIAIMATTSLKIFMAETGIGRDYCSVTTNEPDVAQAMSESGIVFFKPYNRKMGTVWVRGAKVNGRFFPPRGAEK